MESLGTRVTSVQSTDQQTTRSPQARRGAAQVKHALSSGPCHPFRLWTTTVFDSQTSSYSDVDQSAHSQRPTADRLREVNRPNSRSSFCRQFNGLIGELLWAHFTSSYFPFFDTVPTRRFLSHFVVERVCVGNEDFTDQQTNVSGSSDSVGFPPSPTKVHLFSATLPPVESKNFRATANPFDNMYGRVH